MSELIFWGFLYGFIGERSIHYSLKFYNAWQRKREQERFKLTIDREQAAFIALSRKRSDWA